MSERAQYHYFKPSGKWAYSGEGEPIPQGWFKLSHERLRNLNGGSMPGIISDATEYYVVVIDENSYPRMLPPVKTWGSESTERKLQRIPGGKL